MMNLQRKLIVSHLLGQSQEALSFIFEDMDAGRLRASANYLREECWSFSHEERIMLWTALYILTGEGELFVTDLLRLNERAYSSVIAALNSTRDLPNPLSPTLRPGLLHA